MGENAGTDEKAIELSVIAPCYNEELNVVPLAERLLAVFTRRGIVGEVVLVDDGSQDGTWATLEALAARFEGVRPVRHPRNRGMEAAWNTGLEHARGVHACFIDADMQNPPEDVWRLYRELKASQCDVVQGTRSPIGRLRDSRYVLSKGLNVILNLGFGMALTDNKSGFVMARRETLREVLKHRFHYYYFQSLIAVSAFAQGYVWREVETLFQSRLYGQSFINRFPGRMVARILIDMAKAWVEFRLLHRRDGERELPEMPELSADTGGFWRGLCRLPGAGCGSGRRLIYLARLQQSQWLAPREVRALQQTRLQRLLRHLRLHVPHFHNLLREESGAPEAVLARLPVMDYGDLREALFFDLFANNHRKSRLRELPFATPGQRLGVRFLERRQREMQWALALRGLTWGGWEWGEPWAEVTGVNPAPGGRWQDLLLRRQRVGLSPSGGPWRVVTGDAGLLARLDQGQGGLERRFPGARFVLTNAITSPEPEGGGGAVRMLRRFGAAGYGIIAQQCEKGGDYHLMAESFLVEVLRDGQPVAPGETGEVVITDLDGYDVPLVRLRLGVMAVAVDPEAVCPCGRGLPRIRLLPAPQPVFDLAGQPWPATFVAELLKGYHFAIAGYACSQPEADVLEITLTPTSLANEHVLKELESALAAHLPTGSTLRVRLDSPLTP